MNAPKGSNMLMVDSHAHIWLKDMPLMANPRHRLDYDFSIEQYLAVLAEHGVDYAVIAAASPYGDYNDYTIESIRNRPRLRGTVILEPNVERPTLASRPTPASRARLAAASTTSRNSMRAPTMASHSEAGETSHRSKPITWRSDSARRSKR